MRDSLFKFKATSNLNEDFPVRWKLWLSGSRPSLCQFRQKNTHIHKALGDSQQVFELLYFVTYCLEQRVVLAFS